jgi:branched-subunit amino acid aminotransferase/4-amino-4-deoxychorismate lyase
VVWIDGELKRGRDATLSVFDRGARDGEGLFETLRVYRGQPFQWRRHLERLVLSAAELGFPVPPSPSLLAEALAALLAEQGLAEAVARITVTRGVPGGRPTRAGCWVEVEPLEARLWAGTGKGAATVILSRRPFEPGPLGRHKTTSRLAYHLAREEARAHGADEALLVTSRGEVLEGAASNLFAVIGGELATPPLASGILPGITRALLLAACPGLGLRAVERPIPREELAAAGEILLSNSVQEVVPVGILEGRALTAGPVGGRLREAYRALVAAG